MNAKIREAMIDAVRLAMSGILHRRLHLAADRAGGRKGGLTAGRIESEVVTCYARALEEVIRLHGIGLVYERPTGEGDAVAREVIPSDCPCFVIDPIDGTDAFMKLHASGIATMIALVENDQVKAAFVGDAITGEIFGYGPGDEGAEHIFNDKVAWSLKPRPIELGEGRVLLRKAPGLHGEPTQRLLATRYDRDFETGTHGLFRGQITEDGSMGLSFTKLFKGEVAGLVIPRRPDTPWDMAPVVGIMRRLGFVGIRIDWRTGEMSEVPWSVPSEKTPPRTERLVIHESRLAELQTWIDWPRENNK